MPLENEEFARGVVYGQSLLGGCDSGDELGECSGDFADGVDSVVGRCEVCSWWVEAHELNEDQICEDCADAD